MSIGFPMAFQADWNNSRRFSQRITVKFATHLPGVAQQLLKTFP